MPVSDRHPDFVAAAPAWQLCRDVAAGSRQVKERGTAYLPRPSGMDAADYGNYLKRAALFPALGRTVQALAGAVHAKPPAVSAPAAALPDLRDVTLRDESLEDVALQATQEVLTTGRCGILVDHAPAAGDPAGARPYWVLYEAEDVINWRTEHVGSDPSQLVQVVLSEYGPPVDEVDDFSRKVEERYRELALVDGVYRTRLWARDPALVVDVAKRPWVPGEWITPTRRGEPLHFIPFTFLGPSGVTPEVTKPPLEDLAEVVIAHFRNSADHEHGLFLVALPTPWVAGASGDNQALKIGPSVCWKLDANGRAGLLEFTGAGLAAIREAMAAKEKMMAILGGRLLLEEPHAQAETATSAMLRYGAESATLRTIASAVSAALTRALRWHAWWVGTDDEPPLGTRVDLSRELLQVRATPDEVRALLMLAQAGKVSFDTFFHLLQQGGWTRPGITAEAEAAAIRSEEPGLLDESGSADGGPGGGA
jgi:hypothetical protein